MSIDAARATLRMIAKAQPLEEEKDIMFPDYMNSDELCCKMLVSLKDWPDVDSDFLKDVVAAFENKDARRGMQLARERVHFYIPKECGWKYMD